MILVHAWRSWLARGAYVSEVEGSTPSVCIISYIFLKHMKNYNKHLTSSKITALFRSIVFMIGTVNLALS